MVRSLRSDEETLDVVLERVEGGLDLGAFGHGDRGGNDGAGDAAGTAKRSLGLDKDVGHVLVFAQQGNVHQNLNRLCVGSHHNQLGNTTVQCLRSYQHTVSFLCEGVGETNRESVW